MYLFFVSSRSGLHRDILEDSVTARRVENPIGIDRLVEDRGTPPLQVDGAVTSRGHVVTAGVQDFRPTRLTHVSLHTDLVRGWGQVVS